MLMSFFISAAIIKISFKSAVYPSYLQVYYVTDFDHFQEASLMRFLT